VILRAKILDNGMSQHRCPWIAPDIELADLKEPKFHPMDTQSHTSNWLDREHFEQQHSDLRRIRSLALDAGPDLDQSAYPVAHAPEAGSCGIRRSRAVSSGTHGSHR
jgi:hypothetical protein